MELKNLKKPTIGIIGLGFVGLTLAVVNSKKGFRTIAIDNNKQKILSFKNNEPDFFEPKLKKYLKNANKNNILFSDKLKEVTKSDIIFVTVGTPSKNNGEIDLSNLKKVIIELKEQLKNKNKKFTVVIKSTVIPTTTLKIVSKILKLKNITVLVNPEFLREGAAINDLLNPHLIVIGGKNKSETKVLEKYYKQFYKKEIDTIVTDFSTAELIKYANNAFLATKISFINSIANICQNIPNADVNTISKAIGKDERISPYFLQAGPGFGGSCLPKDLDALINFSKKIQKEESLFSSVKKINDTQPEKVISLLKSENVLKKNKIISVLGLSFKKDTDDIREAISIKILKQLLHFQVKINVHDPMAINNIREIFGNKISYFENISDCLKNSQCCILLTDWDLYKELKPKDFSQMKNKTIIDARRVLNPEKFSKLQYKAIGLGR